MTSPSTTTSSSNRTGIGSKIKGAAQVAHGLGENVRGTILGGVETALHKDSAANDAIAARGRAEHADGMAKVARAPAAGVEGVEGHLGTPPTDAATQNTNQDYSGGLAQRGTHANNVGAPPSVPETRTRGAEPGVAPQPLNAQPGYAEAAPGSTTPPQGQPAPDIYNPHYDSTAVAQGIPAYDGAGNAQRARGDRPPDEPRHHREDAIDASAGRVEGTQL